MGFWDKVKSVKNMVTGGAAKVHVEFMEHERELGEPFNVKITAHVKDADLSINGVYLKLRAEERIEADGIEVEYEHGEQEVEREIVRKSVTTFQHEINVSGPEDLTANETYEWEVEIVIPDNLNGTYRGQFAWHEYALFAGLDATGNDPDSGWVGFEIY